jgi:hypothetical protein
MSGLATLRREELDELRDDLFSDVLSPSLESRVDWPASTWPCLIERYVKGEVKLLCEFRAVGDSAQTSDYLAMFERIGAESHQHRVANTASLADLDRIRNSGGCSTAYVEQAMLVGVAHLADTPKGIAVRRVGSIARLQVSDNTLRGFADSADVRTGSLSSDPLLGH